MKKRKRNLYKYFFILFIIILLGILSPDIFRTLEDNSNTKSLEKSNIISNQIIQNNINISEIKEIDIDKEKLNILYLDVGQADSEIIFYKDKLIIIDTGNSNDSEKIISFLKDRNVTKIDYLIGTHIHEDHIGSMQYIVKEFEIENMYLPYNESNTSIYYKNLLIEVSNKNLMINEVEVGDKLNIEDLECEIKAVDNNEPKNANDASIVIEMSYKNYKFLFTGDATKKVEDLGTWNDIDVLKVGHHGSDTSNSLAFIDTIKPEISIISVGKDNNYNLPKESTINRLENAGSKVYRTDIDGTIQIVVDENSYELYKIDKNFDGNRE